MWVKSTGASLETYLTFLLANKSRLAVEVFANLLTNCKVLWPIELHKGGWSQRERVLFTF